MFSFKPSRLICLCIWPIDKIAEIQTNFSVANLPKASSECNSSCLQIRSPVASQKSKCTALITRWTFISLGKNCGVVSTHLHINALMHCVSTCIRRSFEYYYLHSFHISLSKMKHLKLFGNMKHVISLRRQNSETAWG